MQTIFSGNIDSEAILAGRHGAERNAKFHERALGLSGGSATRDSSADPYSCQFSSAGSDYTELGEITDRLQSSSQDIDEMHAEPVASGLTLLNSPSKPAPPKPRLAVYGAAAQARRKAIRAMRLIAIAQHLAQVESSEATVGRGDQSGRQCQPRLKTHSQRHKRKGATQPNRVWKSQRRDLSRSGSQCQPAATADPLDDHLAALVGVRISVLQDIGEALQSFCKGRVTKVDNRGMCGVDFDNGTHEWLQLGQQNFRLLGPRAPSAGLSPAMQAAMLSTSAINRAESRATPSWSRCHVPPGHSAIGGRVSIFFPGDGHQHSGWVLAHDRRRGRHHVLYDDGEDEWIFLSADASSWESASIHCPRHGGLPPDTEPPGGMAAVGYNVAVYWKEDAIFCSARVTAFDHSSGAHMVLYKDGACESLCLRDQTIKWLHQPQARTVPLVTQAALHTSAAWPPYMTLSLPAECTVKPFVAPMVSPQHAHLPSSAETHDRFGCDSPVLLGLPLHRGSRVGGTWEPATVLCTSNSPTISRSQQRSSAEGDSGKQYHPLAALCSQAASEDLRRWYESGTPSHELQRPLSMPLLRSSGSDDVMCSPMVPCGGIVPRSQSDPGPHLLSEDGYGIYPFESASWTGGHDTGLTELIPPSSQCCDPTLALNCSKRPLGSLIECNGG